MTSTKISKLSIIIVHWLTISHLDPLTGPRIVHVISLAAWPKNDFTNLPFLTGQIYTEIIKKSYLSSLALCPSGPSSLKDYRDKIAVVWWQNHIPHCSAGCKTSQRLPTCHMSLLHSAVFVNRHMI